MEIVLILLLLVASGGILLLLYKIIKWTFAKKARAIGVFSSLCLLVLALTIYQSFFVKMQFIQSRVYPDLFLVKHPIEDKTALHQAIKNFVTQKMKSTQLIKPNYSLRFYEYYKNWSPLLFSDAGTAYFIDNEEDFGGLVVEELGMYHKYKLATFTIHIGRTDSARLYGLLNYFDKEWAPVKTDTVFITNN
ncbi:hypothetical protein ABDK00_012005 [Niabella insulamsoli]|uniref:hypothetical protein n=1 Tax=Niabella insulamsoli TaxID=3144874 RepID=UPI0031FDCA64